MDPPDKDPDPDILKLPGYPIRPRPSNTQYITDTKVHKKPSSVVEVKNYVGQEGQAIPNGRTTSVAEVGSVTSSNIRLEHSRTAVSSSASKPGSTIKKKNRGQKRSQSSVHVASDTSNHFPEHGCSLNQRLSWPIDHCSRGFNSDYNHNQWTQPEGPPQYHLFLSTI
ncbi:hypothetical protein F2Q69_00039760 [Brassica cretica]|uniref:Uncharacterized protein n=1 Tax=Brassica cretica TaxID=69181 RepID=A0A8S9N554_BRACR|nr:hypothetical protein F2Q69_00039760 [Brassica cretica]